MILLVLMILLLLGVVGCVGGFILAEALALRDATDNLFTFSTYWKDTKQKHPVLKIIFNIAVSLLCLVLIYTAVWLFGHLVVEAW